MSKETFLGTDREPLKRAQRWLPTWFVPRMMTDAWAFGWRLHDGMPRCIEQIRDVRLRADGVSLDVILLDAPPRQAPAQCRWWWAPTKRPRASLAKRDGMTAFELADA